VTRRPPIPARELLAESRFPPPRPQNRINSVQQGNAIALAARRYATGRLVDIGCGIKPFAPTFEPYVTEHVGVDHADSVHELDADIIAGAYEIPLPDGGFQTALLSEVLEHLEEPQAALRETFRLLAPGGKLILTTPFMWPLHEEPRDFFRYSPHGLRYLLEQAGFEVLEVTPLAGQWTTIAQLAGYVANRSPLRRTPRLLEAWLRASHWAAIRLDERQFEPWFSYDHLAVAAKPSA